jgi:hypothetical protein
MLIDIAPYLRKRRRAKFVWMSRYFRQQGFTFMEAARFAKASLSFTPQRNAQVIPYGPPSDLPH